MNLGMNRSGAFIAKTPLQSRLFESEARYPNGGNVYYVTMQITFPIPELSRKERNFHCDVVHITTVWVSRLVLDHAIAAIQMSR